MVIRKAYLEQLKSWKDEMVVKVVTGIRRCGKSTLLMQYQDYLRENGVAENQIISINFEELEYEHLLDYRALYGYIKERLCADKMTYIFLDEIQKVPDFQKVVDSLYVKRTPMCISPVPMLICCPVILLRCLPEDMWRFPCFRYHSKNILILPVEIQKQLLQIT